MPDSNKADIVRHCFAAFLSQDRPLMERLLAEDFSFTSPYDDAIDKAVYFERCWPNAHRIREHIIEEIAEREDEAFVLYRCVTTEGTEFRNVELFRFAGERVRGVEVYFGASYRDGAFVRKQ